MLRPLKKEVVSRRSLDLCGGEQELQPGQSEKEAVRGSTF